MPLTHAPWKLDIFFKKSLHGKFIMPFTLLKWLLHFHDSCRIRILLIKYLVNSWIVFLFSKFKWLTQGLLQHAVSFQQFSNSPTPAGCPIRPFPFVLALATQVWRLNSVRLSSFALTSVARSSGYLHFCPKWSRWVVSDFATPWTVARQAPPSMGFSKQEYWSGLPFPSPGYLPIPRIECTSPTMASGFFTTEPPWNPWVKPINS